jgi:hypothetical protein
MRKTIAVGMVLLLFASFFVLSPSCAATKPEDVSIRYYLFVTGPNSGSGGFVATGAITDSGDVQETFRMNGKGIHSEVTLTGGLGTITIKYQAKLIPIGGLYYEIQGQFTVIHGTNTYTNLHGVGYIDSDMTIGTIYGYYDGLVHWD